MGTVPWAARLGVVAVIAIALLPMLSMGASVAVLAAAIAGGLLWDRRDRRV